MSLLHKSLIKFKRQFKPIIIFVSCKLYFINTHANKTALLKQQVDHHPFLKNNCSKSSSLTNCNFTRREVTLRRSNRCAARLKSTAVFGTTRRPWSRKASCKSGGPRREASFSTTWVLFCKLHACKEKAVVVLYTKRKLIVHKIVLIIVV